MSTVYTFQRGETILLALDAVDGDPATVTIITAKLRQQLAPNTEIAFQVASRAGGWTMTIDAVTSEGMVAGYYEAEAKLELPGQTIITDRVQVRLK